MRTPRGKPHEGFDAPPVLRGLGARVWSLAMVIGLAILFSVPSVQAHEPYLLLHDNGNGTFTAETGFSDGSDVAGLKLLLRSRASGESLGEHVLPAGGKLTLPIPSTPYRVTFDGGPGHKISKPGPEAPPAPTTKSMAGTPAERSSGPAVKTSSASPAEIRSVGEQTDVWLVVSLVFALAIVSFALGYVAGAGKRKSA